MSITSRSLLFFHLLQALLAQAFNSDTVTCPKQEVSLRMTGVTAGNKLVESWQKVYTSEHCPDFNITFEPNSWDSASARVCASSLIYEPVDLAGMSGSFFPSQASTIDGWSYQCKRSTLQRETTVVRNECTKFDVTCPRLELRRFPFP